MYVGDDLLALSGLQHLAFCERQWALIHLEQAWEDSAETVAGDLFHERVDQPGYSTRNDVISHRRVRLTNHQLGIYGVADIVECEKDSTGVTRVTPVEYKVGSPKIEDWDRVQVTAQAMCLEEMWDIHIEDGALFYGKTRRRERVSIDEDARQRVINLARRMHELYEAGVVPPAKMRSICNKCSLKNVCLPETLGKSATSYWLNMGEKVGE